MGNEGLKKPSTGFKKSALTSYELQNFIHSFELSEKQVVFLFDRFTSAAACRGDDGVIDYEEFLSLVNLRDGLFTRRLFTMMDASNDGKLNFREFLTGVNLLVTTDKDTLSDSLFELCDVRGSRSVSLKDLADLIVSALSQMPSVAIPRDLIERMIQRDLMRFKDAIYAETQRKIGNDLNMRRLHRVAHNIDAKEKEFHFDFDAFRLYVHLQSTVTDMQGFALNLLFN